MCTTRRPPPSSRRRRHPFPTDDPLLTSSMVGDGRPPLTTPNPNSVTASHHPHDLRAPPPPAPPQLPSPPPTVELPFHVTNGPIVGYGWLLHALTLLCFPSNPKEALRTIRRC
jgi:hypothetical protein